jgi:hypothetical protein
MKNGEFIDQLRKYQYSTYFPYFVKIERGLMRSRCCLSVPPPNAGIVESEETVIASQRLLKPFPAANSTHATIEAL